MRRLRSLAAWLLVVLWLPATLHCSLEQAGLLGGDEACAESCATDNCDVLESGLFKSTTAVLKVPAPTALTCLCCLNEITPETIVVPPLSPEGTVSPPELARTWQFTARAAPPPRAPSPAS
jgi:hypothetical protein